MPFFIGFYKFLSRSLPRHHLFSEPSTSPTLGPHQAPKGTLSDIQGHEAHRTRANKLFSFPGFGDDIKT